jgi:ABC-type multidrug transport system fused ATPase/permease subunit
VIDIHTWKKAWALLNASEKRIAWLTLAVVILSALSSALMVGSVLPFLSVLSDPGQIDRIPALQWAYHAFGFRDSYTFLVALGLASGGVILFASFIQILKTYIVARFSMMRIHSISHRLLTAYLSQPYTYFLSRHSGEMSTRVLAESEQLVMQFLRPASEAITALLTVFAIVALLLWLDPLVAVIAFGVLGGTYGVIFTLSRRFLKLQGAVRAKANSERFRITNEVFGGIKDIKLLGRERSYADQYIFPSHRMARAVVGVQVLAQMPQFLLQAVAFGGVILLCIVLMDPQGLDSGAALGGLLPVLGVFAFAGQRLMPELSKLYQSLAQLQAGGAAVNAVYDDLSSKNPIDASPDENIAALRLKDRLELSRVSFRYPNASRAGLNDVSLIVPAGKRVGIVGSTGAGKTTLADLILGLLRPSDGSILVDGHRISAANLRGWQKSVGYVPQDIFLTDASVSENIALGVPVEEIDDARVQRAAKIARIAEFISNDLPDAYATGVGEKGVRLSGGQRQRLGIARALYHDADLIVFDEATSALDNLTEHEVIAAIDALPGGKTVLMIAHRLSTVRRCDVIVVLENGRIAGCGSWEELMANSTAFQKIARLNDTA